MKSLLQFLQWRLGGFGTAARVSSRMRGRMVMMGIVACLMGICQPLRSPRLPITYAIILPGRRSTATDYYMALGIVSDDIFEVEAGISNTTPSAVIIQHQVPTGRPTDTLNTPESIRKIIGDTAVESGRQNALEIGEFFGVSNSSVSAYAKGATSTASYHKTDKALSKHINITKERIAKRAVNRLNKTFDALTDDKFSEASGPELATMAKSFAAIVKDMTPEAERQSGPQVQFVIHTPPITKEEKFTTIIVNDLEE